MLKQRGVARGGPQRQATTSLAQAENDTSSTATKLYDVLVVLSSFGYWYTSADDISRPSSIMMGVDKRDTNGSAIIRPHV
jgi:hypothetical protein